LHENIFRKCRLRVCNEDIEAPQACDDYITRGFYDTVETNNTGNMVLDANLATTLTGGASHSNKLLLVQSSLPDLSSLHFPVKTNTSVLVIYL
jgi:hypothetical protein